MEILRLKLEVGVKSYYFTSKNLTPSEWRTGEYIDWTNLDDESLINSISKAVESSSYCLSKIFRIRTLVRSKCKKRKLPVVCIIAELYDNRTDQGRLMEVDWNE